MGRLLGAHADEQELDRPDLNKCPDCGCYFPQLNCPLCGKECPENMRAGNRAPVKQVKRKRGGSGRVIFVNWYHSLWFITLMMLFMPVIGMILLFTSPHSKKIKIIFTVIAAVGVLLYYVGISGILGWTKSLFERPVDTSMSREEYVAACDSITCEEFYRFSDEHKEEFVSMEVRVLAKITDADAEYSHNKYPNYYLCSAVDGEEFKILVRSCLVGSQMNFIPGDVFTLYGEGAGSASVSDVNSYEYYSAPCVNMAYYDKK